MLLCSSSEKTFAKIKLFCFGGPYIDIGKKGAMLRHTQNQNQPFSVRNKKQIISFQKLPTLSKYHMQRLNLQNSLQLKQLEQLVSCTYLV